MFLVVGGANAQQGFDPRNLPPGVSAEDIQRELERRGTQPMRQPLEASERVVFSPRIIEQTPEPPSRLETLMSRRAGITLKQFGYEIFGPDRHVVFRQTGAIQDSYVLGLGDEVVIELRGQQNTSFRIRVDRDGRIILPELSPVTAAGRTFGEFRAELQDRIRQAYIATEAFISLGEVRQVSVLVAGEVREPGTKIVTGLSTVVDAIMLAGGIKKTGSLRTVRVVRQGQSFTVDLYALFSDVEDNAGMTLAEGDRIIVPPLGPTVAVTGGVRRPAIYELAEDQQRAPVLDILAMAGGVEVRGSYRFSVLRIQPDGERRFVHLARWRQETVADSEILFVNPAVDHARGRVELTGAVRTPGTFSLQEVRSLAGLLRDREQFADGSYLLFGIISRRDPQTLFRHLIPFSPSRVLRREADLPFFDEDIVHIFTVHDIARLTSAADMLEEADQEAMLRRLSLARRIEPVSRTEQEERDRLNGRLMQPQNRVNEEEEGALALLGLDQSGELRERERVRETRLEPELDQFISSKAGHLNVARDVLAAMVSDYMIAVAGAVRQPGSYLILPQTPIGEVLAAAGGPGATADLGSVQITQTIVDQMQGRSRTSRQMVSLNAETVHAITVSPRDVINLRDVFSDLERGRVIVSGEVRHQGTYDILRGERLSELLQRAGGLTDNAYPYGAIFTRRSVAEQERLGYLRAAREIESQVLGMLTREEVAADKLAFVERLARQLVQEEGFGRVSVEADPSVLAARPELDIRLEPGDMIHIPRRPSTITVMGMVLNPGTYQFRSGQSARNYIELAGGYARFADSGRTFIIYPDGTTRRMSSGMLSLSTDMIPPGSVIVVPRDMTPFQLDKFLKDFTQITSQLAISAASIAVIADRAR